jgi:hypothetical protein
MTDACLSQITNLRPPRLATAMGTRAQHYRAPEGVSTVAASLPRVDNTMIKALARAFRWRKLLETGAITTVEYIAAAEKINPSYVSRVLRLTLASTRYRRGDSGREAAGGDDSAERVAKVAVQPLAIIAERGGAARMSGWCWL